MNGHKAKFFRKLVYGADGSPRVRGYKKHGATVYADKKRRAYQKLKANPQILEQLKEEYGDFLTTLNG